jgi:hypothetical protein
LLAACCCPEEAHPRNEMSRAEDEQTAAAVEIAPSPPRLPVFCRLRNGIAVLIKPPRREIMLQTGRIKLYSEGGRAVVVACKLHYSYSSLLEHSRLNINGNNV